MNSQISRRAAIAWLCAMTASPALAQPVRPEGTVTTADGPPPAAMSNSPAPDGPIG